MTVGPLILDGNVLEIAILAALLSVLAVAFLTGRLAGLNRRGAEERSIEALKLVRASAEEEIDRLGEEKERIRKEGLRAEVALERWDAVKNDHARLEEMRRELDGFEREESGRIDELERRRAEAARRLGEVQTALDPYPSEITGPDGDWDELIAKRKSDHDELRRATEDAENEFADVDARRTQAADEAAKLERRKTQLENEIDAAQELLDHLNKGQIDTLKPYNERLLEEANQLRGQIENLDRELQEKKEDLDLTKRAIEERKDSASERQDVAKLSAFRSMPDCLGGYEDVLAKTDEEDLLSDFEVALRSLGLQYPPQIVRAFHTALKVNDLSPLTVLSGLSGTGKSQLPRAYARFFGIHFLHVPVEPGWDSPQDLLGFYDFVAERYRPTDRARALGHFDNRFAKEIGIEDDRNWSERMLIILLDEMNLARTEYYFSEFLSRLEMRGPRRNGDADEEGRGDAQIAIDLPYAEGERPKHLYVPHNVLWVGTLNEDETTQALSDKVLDRANSIRFAPPDPVTLREHSTAPERGIKVADGYLPYKRWLEWSDRATTGEAAVQEIGGTLEELAKLMQGAGRGFGYRIAQSIKAYIHRYPGQDWRTAMIDQINMRLLPKLAGAEMSDCQETVDGLRRLSEDMLSNPAFAKALQDAATASEASQIFTWPGYTYEETRV